MSRPTLEVADIIRATGNSFMGTAAVASCMAASQGARCHRPMPHRGTGRSSRSVRPLRPSGHLVSTHAAIGTARSARANARAQMAGGALELNCCPFRTSTLSSHCRMNCPHWSSRTRRLLYDLLYRTSAATLLELARDPKHLGADIGFLGVLHTWGQNLEHHPHVHYVVPAGGLALDGSRWIDSSRRFFLPVHALSRVFRGKFVAGLKRALPAATSFSFTARISIWPHPEAFQLFLRQSVSTGLGRLRQATLRRRRTCSQLSGPLHPSRSHLQPSSRGLRERSAFHSAGEDYAHGGKKKIMTRFRP